MMDKESIKLEIDKENTDWLLVSKMAKDIYMK